MRNECQRLAVVMGRVVVVWSRKTTTLLKVTRYVIFVSLAVGPIRQPRSSLRPCRVAAPHCFASLAEPISSVQIEGQGSLGRSIDNKDGSDQRPGGGAVGFDGSGAPGGLVPPNPPSYRSSPLHPRNSPPPPRFRQRAHSDPPFASHTVSGPGGDGLGAVWNRSSPPIAPPVAAAGPAEVAEAPSRGIKGDARATTTKAVDGDTFGTARGDLRARARTSHRALSLDSNVYPEVLSAVGLGFEQATLSEGQETGMRPATAPARAAGFDLSGPEKPDSSLREASHSQRDPESVVNVEADGMFSPLAVVVDESVKKGSREGEGGTGGGVSGRDKSPARRGNASSNSRLSRADLQDLVLPEPLVEEGLTGDEQASEVADVMLR